MVLQNCYSVDGTFLASGTADVFQLHRGIFNRNKPKFYSGSGLKSGNACYLFGAEPFVFQFGIEKFKD